MLTGSVSRQGGGVFDAVRGLSLALRDHHGVDVHVFGLEDTATAADLAAWASLPVHAARTSGPRAFGYARDLHSAIARARLDVLHVACPWMYPTLVSLRWMHENGGPVVASLHGSLDPWALANARLKKRIAAACYERRHLERAACLHALSQAEADTFRDFGLTNPICVVPNGVDLPHLSATGPAAPWADRLPADAKVLLFLGRLHPKKNIPALIEAWTEVSRHEASAANWWLVVAGWDQLGHLQQCQSIVARTSAPRVLFAGPQHGAGKHAAFRSAAAFVLPSLSEGLPMAVLEAWSYGLPVLMTPECNLPQGASGGAAVEIGRSPEAIAAGLRQLLAMGDSERAHMGAAGRRLVAECFTWARIADEMASVYEWVLRPGTRPASCVQACPA